MKGHKKLAALGFSALFAGGLLAAPSVEITNVQQQYPWTNTVDITYTVQGVNKTHQTNRLDHIVNDTYFATFEAKNGNTPIQDVNGNTIFTNGLVQGNGTFTAQWQPKTDLQLTGCTMTPSVFRGEENAYFIVDLVPNKNGRYNSWFEPMSTQEASNERYQALEYKTSKMVFRRVPAGTYKLGINGNGHYWVTGFNAQHSVTTSRDYYIAIYETTVAQVNRVLNGTNDTNAKPRASISYSMVRGNASPGVSITPDASNNSQFLVKLNALIDFPTAKLGIDLPTEAMWEIAARAGSSAHYHWGNNADGSYAWYNANSGDATHIVGTKKPNQWGIYDTMGNVWEWARDVYYSGQMSTFDSDPFVPNTRLASGDNASNRPGRGGSDYGDPWEAPGGWHPCPSIRYRVNMGRNSIDWGFRTALYTNYEFLTL